MTLDLIEALRSVLGTQKIALHEPRFWGSENKYVSECIQTGWVSSVGKFVDRFEEDLAQYTGVKKAVVTVNGTSALHMALLLAGVLPQDEVLMPALTFVGTANAVAYTGAQPHFVDVDSRTMGLCPSKLRSYLKEVAVVKNNELFNRLTQKRISAVVPVHIFGHPVKIDHLLEVAQEFHLTVVEDAAESLGSFYKKQHTGSFGKLGILSFNGNKLVTTGGGGAILTNDENLAVKAKHLTTTAKLPHAWEYKHDAVGYNYRMPNLNAALGCAQLENVERFVLNKRKLYLAYAQALKNTVDVSLVQEPEEARSNYWLQAIKVTSAQKKNILQKLNAQGLMSRPVWSLMSELSMFRNAPKSDLSTSLDLAARLINIPSSAGLVDE